MTNALYLFKTTTPLIAVTGYGQDADRLESRRPGFDRHLTKPVDTDTLHDILRSLTAKPDLASSR